MTVNAGRRSAVATMVPDSPDKIRVTGHRGAMAHAPENTALSLVTAEQLGVDEIEFDVRLSADGVPVISHDDDLGRVLGSTAAPSVRAASWRDLQRLRLPRGQRLLTLPEVLELTQTDLQVEVKALEAAAVVAEVLADDPDDQRRYVLTSFQAPILAELQRLLPQVPRGLIAGSYDDALRVGAHEVGATSLMSGWKGLTRSVVDQLHEEGFHVAGWSLRTSEDAVRAVQLGVDMITADAPGQAREWLDEARVRPA